MEFRKLKGNDIFTVSRILAKMDLKVEVTENMSQEQYGADLIMKVLSNLHLAQKEVNDFLGSMVGITGKEVGDLPLEEYFELIEEFKNIEGLPLFLSQAKKLTK